MIITDTQILEDFFDEYRLSLSSAQVKQTRILVSAKKKALDNFQLRLSKPLPENESGSEILEYQILNKSYYDGLHYVLSQDQLELLKSRWSRLHEDQLFLSSKSYFSTIILFRQIIFRLVNEIVGRDNYSLSRNLQSRIQLFSEILPQFESDTPLFNEVKSLIEDHQLDDQNTLEVKREVENYIKSILKKHQLHIKTDLKAYVDGLFIIQDTDSTTSGAANEPTLGQRIEAYITFFKKYGQELSDEQVDRISDAVQAKCDVIDTFTQSSTKRLFVLRHLYEKQNIVLKTVLENTLSLSQLSTYEAHWDGKLEKKAYGITVNEIRTDLLLGKLQQTFAYNVLVNWNLFLKKSLREQLLSFDYHKDQLNTLSKFLINEITSALSCSSGSTEEMEIQNSIRDLDLEEIVLYNNAKQRRLAKAEERGDNASIWQLYKMAIAQKEWPYQPLRKEDSCILLNLSLEQSALILELKKNETLYSLTGSDTEKYLWYRVAKVGTRSITEILSNFTTITHYGNNSFFDRDPKYGDDYFKFAFVRNPFSRVVSAYKDKVVGRVLFGKCWGKDFGYFLKYLKEIDLTTADKHIRLQSCLFPIENVDFIGKLESFEPDINYVKTKLGLENVEIPVINSTKNQLLKTDFFRAEWIKEVEKLYKADYIKLKYSFRFPS